jgi:hypothetical protein
MIVSYMLNFNEVKNTNFENQYDYNDDKSYGNNNNNSYNGKYIDLIKNNTKHQLK